jgi:hypothetical protein
MFLSLKIGLGESHGLTIMRTIEYYSKIGQIPSLSKVREQARRKADEFLFQAERSWDEKSFPLKETL